MSRVLVVSFHPDTFIAYTLFCTFDTSDVKQEKPARALFSAMSKSSTRKNKRSPLPGGASPGLIKDGCSYAAHWWRQSKTVPSVSGDKPRQGVVANTLAVIRSGAVGFIDWLDGLQLLAHYLARSLVPNTRAKYCPAEA
jgi:hypothetical protein